MPFQNCSYIIASMEEVEMALEELKELYERLAALFFSQCRRLGLRVDKKAFEQATGISVGKNRRRWQVSLVLTSGGRRKNHSLGLVPDEKAARRVASIYSAAKHILRAIERLQKASDRPRLT